jgi:hypothetical protein
MGGPSAISPLVQQNAEAAGQSSATTTTASPGATTTTTAQAGCFPQQPLCFPTTTTTTPPSTTTTKPPAAKPDSVNYNRLTNRLEMTFTNAVCRTADNWAVGDWKIHDTTSNTDVVPQKDDAPLCSSAPSTKVTFPFTGTISFNDNLHVVFDTAAAAKFHDATGQSAVPNTFDQTVF